MLYAIHDRDSGEIYQANKVYVSDDELKKYESEVTNLGHAFVKVNAPGLLPPDDWYVSGGELRERPMMRTKAFASVIKAGTSALLLKIPRGAAVTISAAGAEIHSIAKLDGDELEFPIPVPCKYRAVVRMWPYRDAVLEIEAVQ
jgi:hypothetical protein